MKNFPWSLGIQQKYCFPNIEIPSTLGKGAPIHLTENDSVRSATSIIVTRVSFENNVLSETSSTMDDPSAQSMPCRRAAHWQA